jgi:hypothetical protein
MSLWICSGCHFANYLAELFARYVLDLCRIASVGVGWNAASLTCDRTTRYAITLAPTEP